MRRLLLTVFMFATVVAGCASSPGVHGGGLGPYPENHESLIRNYLEDRLGGPDAFKDLTINKPPEKVTLDTYYALIPLFEGQQVWECFVVYNAKNSRGKYTGPDLHVVWIRDNEIVAFDYEGA